MNPINKAPSSIATNQGPKQGTLQNYKFEFSSRKTICPCGKHRSFCRLVGYEFGGKCWNNSCGQQFFPPHEDERKHYARYSSIGYNNNSQRTAVRRHETPSPVKASLEPSSGYVYCRHHVYWNEQGDNFLFRVVVHKPTDDASRKQVSLQRFHGTISLTPEGKIEESGEWYYGLEKTQLTLYNAPRLRHLRNSTHKRDFVVYIVEGEKDADTLTALGAIATTNPMGAMKWRSEYSPLLKGLRCIIVADNDDTGRQHAADVAQKLKGYANSVTQIDLTKIMPALPLKSDISDFIERGGRLWKA